MLESLTVKVDAMVISVAERCAKESGLSLSEWVNQAMWDASGQERPGLGDQLRGMANPIGRQYTDEEIDQLKYDYLKEKYLP